MKCPKCNGNGSYEENDEVGYTWNVRCVKCHGTGEVEDKTIGRISIVPNKELPSGCGMLTNGTLKGTCIFKNASNLDDKPEMPNDAEIYKARLEQANKRISELNDTIEVLQKQVGDSLPKDKVRELLEMIDKWVDANINLYSGDHYKITPDEFRQRAEELGRVRTSIVDRRKALFPEGVDDDK